MLNAGKFKGVKMDLKCFFENIVSVVKAEGIVEGGTGELKKIKGKQEMVMQ